jgi:hypothetical protein
MTDQDLSENEAEGRGMDEMEEKWSEKEHEKSWNEKVRRDPLSSVIWAGILIWAGVVFLVDNLGLITSLTIAGNRMDAWSVAFAGAGAIVLIEVLVRLVMPAYSRPVVGTFIFGMILLSIGLGDIFGWGLIWSVVLIGLGVFYLVRVFTKRE